VETFAGRHFPRATAVSAGAWAGLHLFVGGALFTLFLSTAAPVVAAEGATARSRAAAQLFVLYCIRCHGEDGKGTPGRVTLPVIPDFTDAAWHPTRNDPQLVISILDGKDRLMPTHRGVVTDEQAADLVSYIRSTFGPKTAGPSGAPTSDFDAAFQKLHLEWTQVDQQLHTLPPPTAASASATPELPAAGSPANFFGQHCAACHTIGGGPLTGPDLKHVVQRTDPNWLVQWLQHPKGVLDRGDAHAVQLRQQARGVVMPDIPGMTPAKAKSVLDFIEAESKQEKSRFAAVPIPDRPLTAEDVARGRELFAGRTPLANGGTACIACHSAHGSGGPEGGRLGPELTKVYERVGGRTALIARLWAPATPTMQPLFQQHPLKPDEVHALVAYLENADKRGVEEQAGFPLKFFLFGLGGSVLGLTVVSTLGSSRIWPRGRSLPGGAPAAARHLGGTRAAAPPTARPVPEAYPEAERIGAGL
jgi:mono/diheme cytochrome c family protein